MDEEPFLPVRLPMSQTTHRSMMVKIAIVIISIALLASLGWFLKSDWFWFSWDIVGAMLVAAGCIAEWILLYEDEDEHSDRNKLLEKAWALVVAAGVTMDVFGLIYGIPQAIKLENRVEQLRATNLVLQIELSKVQWRKINPDQRIVLTNGIMKLVKLHKFDVVVWAQDAESRSYGNDIIEAFQACGIRGSFFVNGGFRSDIALTPGVTIATFNPTNAPFIAAQAGVLFTEAGIFTRLEYEGEYAKQFFSEDNINIFIGAKEMPKK